MTSRHLRLTKRFLLPASLLLPLSAPLAADVAWENPGTGLFTEGANWDTGLVPSDVDNAFLMNGGTAQIQADEFISVNTLRVLSGGVELSNAFLSTGITSSTWQSSGDLQVGGIPGMNGSLTTSGNSQIAAGRVRIGGWNEGGTEQSDMHGSLTMSDSSALIISPAGFDFWLGNGVGSTGTLTMSGSSQIAIEGAGGTAGRAGGSATAVQSGSSRFESLGQFVFGEGGTADWTVSGEAVLQVGGNLVIGGGDNSDATMSVQDSAFVSAGNQLFVGNGANATAVLNIEGGTVTSSSWIAIGRDEATATLNISGGSLIKTGEGTHFVTNGNADKIATINHTGGTITNTVSETQISERTVNVTNWMASGGVGNFGDLQVGRAGVATLTMSGTANYTATTVRLAVDGTASGVLNLNGGSLTANSVSEGAGSGTINFRGGTLRAGAASMDFIAGFEAGDVVIHAGGAVIDTNAFDVRITLALTGDGGLAKIGAGTLTLTGANTYLGDTAIEGGVLSITSGFLSDSANVHLAEGTVFNLNFVGTDTVNGLTINGVGMETGTWGAMESGADHESALFTGTGLLQVTSVVPEPSTIALVVAGLGAVGLGLRRRRH